MWTLADIDKEIKEEDDEIIGKMSLRQLFVAIYKFLRDLTREYDQNTEDMTICSKDLEILLDVGERTLTRWRSRKMLRYHLDVSGQVYHKFVEVYADVKSGRIRGKGLDRDSALRRLRSYRLGVLKGRMDKGIEYERI